MNVILKSGLMVMAIAVVVGGATTAYFNDTETSTGNLFTAGTLDLKVNDVDITTEKFFIQDVKPGDTGATVLKMTNDGSVDGANLTLTFSGQQNNDNGCNEPEDIVDATCTLGGVLGDDAGTGELGENIDVSIIEVTDATGVTTIGSELTTGADTVNTLGGYNLGALNANATRYFRIAASVATSVGNNIQSDSVEFQIQAVLTQN